MYCVGVGEQRWTLMTKKIIVSVGIGVVLCCGTPMYCFFGHCPVSAEQLSAARRIRIGMRMDQARRLMPEPVTEREGMTYSWDATSVQCECRLEVSYRDGVVTQVEVIRYNDLNHATDVVLGKP